MYSTSETQVLGTVSIRVFVIFLFLSNLLGGGAIVGYHRVFKLGLPLGCMKKQACLECKKEFEVSPFARFPRKYCPKCSEKRKKQWANQWKVKYEDLDDE
jgi:hypothetical protein